jgi:CheY-like chemotaxis protein
MEESFIFLAEDDIDDQELLIEAFAHFDDSISVKVVNNGKKALSFLESLSADQSPCLIVLDYNLPELSGAEILQKLNHSKVFDDVTKVVWSTSNSPVYESVCMALGAKAYLVKPNDISGMNKLAELMLQMCTVKNAREKTA